MMSYDNYVELKRKYGKISSWAIWSPVIDGQKSNTSNLELLNDDYLLEHINTKYVLVGLNVSSDEGMGKAEEKDWSNFHSNHKGQNDYKLRFALEGTKLWGSYITDIIKQCKNPDSKQVMNDYRKGLIDMDKNKEFFQNELDLIGDNIQIIAIGNSAFDILTDMFAERKIVKIRHYATRDNYVKYRAYILEKITML